MSGAQPPLTSAAVPPPGPEDHTDGRGTPVLCYIDFACPACAAEWARLRELPGIALTFRHFPMASKRPRSSALHAAAEAAGRQGRFWELADSLFADPGHVDDPHLWRRAERLGLDLDRFEADRRSDAVAERVRRDFRGGVRGGVTGTPTIVVDGRAVTSPAAAEAERARRP